MALDTEASHGSLCPLLGLHGPIGLVLWDPYSSMGSLWKAENPTPQRSLGTAGGGGGRLPNKAQ